MRPAKPDRKMDVAQVSAFRKQLLSWYDRHRRVLPWRAKAGEAANPYHVWLSEIMLQQTVVAAVIPYFLKFVEKWPAVHDLAAAPQDEVMEAWAGLGYYARARNLHKCAQIVTQVHKGAFPKDQKSLKDLPGIGDYTSAAIAAIAFSQPATVVDGNVERVVARYFALTDPLPDARSAIKQHVDLLSKEREDRPGDFAQAMMDLGASVCIPKTPRCPLCPLRNNCYGLVMGIHASLPFKKRKPPKPRRYGYIYWVQNDKGEILCERRPHNGLLGGMIGLPTSDWLEDRKRLKAPDFLKDFKTLSLEKIVIRHSFTHFDLELYGQLIELNEKKSDIFFFVAPHEISLIPMPTVFKKFVNLMTC